MASGRVELHAHETDRWADADSSAAVLIPAAPQPDASRPVRLEPSGPLAKLLAEPGLHDLLRRYSSTARAAGRESFIRYLSREIAAIDRLVSAQVNTILHHPRFQSLEASWRGLEYLVEQAEDQRGVRIKFLDVSARELEQDQEFASDVEQSILFRKIYTEALSTPGGEPFGVLIGDYEIQLNPVARASASGRSSERLDVRTLASLSQIATAAFCPFIAAASPALFGLDEFSGLQHVTEPERVFQQLDYLPWRKLREDEHTRFVGLALPRVLMRLPYDDTSTRHDGFRFKEDVAGPRRGNYLWGSAAYAFAGVLIRAFGESGWFAHIRGTRAGAGDGGLVTQLSTHYFNTDQPGVTPKMCTEVAVTDELEDHLSGLGFLALSRCTHTEHAAFYTTPSLHKSQKYDRLSATLNAKISAMLQYVFCVSRFAHYLKVIARHKVGRFSSAADCERMLNKWLVRYVCPDATATPQVKAERPLRKAEITVQERIDSPGSFECVIRLWPHYALDELSGTIQLRTEIAPART